eukprot:471231-Alexandrium_andersonii.AAC.1
MSASLVGSEMCIRDRHAMTRVRARAETGEVSHPWIGTPTRSPNPLGCLLYTSDAADVCSV